MSEKDEGETTEPNAASDKDEGDQPEGAADHLPAEVKAELVKLGVDLDDPRARRSVSVLISSVSESFFAGPFPPPKMLADYERLHPGMAERIINLTEEQGAHRRELEKLTTRGAERRMAFGQWNGFALSVIGLVIVGGVSVLGVGWVVPVVIAIVSVGGPTAAVAMARMWGKKNGSPGTGNARAPTDSL